MVAPTDLNLQSLRGRTFQGFVQFQVPDGSTWYRLKERQTMTFNINYNRAEHYDDAGRKAVDPAGTSHSFTMNIKLTSDMFDNVTWTDDNENSGSGDGFVDDDVTGFDKQTLSYWLYQNEINAPIEVIFVTSFTTLSGPSGSATENDVNIKFVLDPSTFTPSLGASGGSPEIVVSGTVLRIQSAVRATTFEQ